MQTYPSYHGGVTCCELPILRSVHVMQRERAENKPSFGGRTAAYISVGVLVGEGSLVLEDLERGVKLGVRSPR